MAKNFTSGIDKLLSSSTDQKESTNSKGREKKQLVRANMVMESHYHKTLKIVAAKEGVNLTEALSEALDDYFAKKGKLLEEK